MGTLRSPLAGEETEAQSVYLQPQVTQLVSGKAIICTCDEKERKYFMGKKEMYAKHLEIRREGEIKQNHVHI